MGPRSAISALLTAGALLLSGCGNDRPAPLVDNGGINTGTTIASSCQRNEPGCTCAAEGKRIACGKVVGKDPTGKVTCGTGGQVCSGGKWSECEIGAYAPGHDGVAIQALGTAGACTDACDLYCKTVLDTPDDTVPLGDGGVVLVDGGISLPQSNRNPDGGPTEEDLAILRDSGGLPDTGPDGYALIFHELLPGETAQDPVILPPGEIPSTDIYFLLDDTASMYEESAALTSAIQASPSMITRIRALFNDDTEKVQFGFGRFEEYKQTKYVTDTSTNLAFQHILSISPDAVNAGIAAQWIREDSYGLTGGAVNHTGGTFPESTTAALMLLATGGNDPLLGFGAARNNSAVSLGSPVCNPANWWVFPRQCWGGTPITGAYFTANSGAVPAAEYPVVPSIVAPCPSVSNPPAGYNAGYPCWRPNKTPIVIVLTDAPSHNGPGGHYSYKQVSGYGIQYAQAFPNASAAPAAVGANDGSTFSKAIPITLPNPGSGAIYAGTVPIRNTPNGVSASYVGGGVIKTETAVDNTGATYTTRQLVDVFPAAASQTVGVEYRSTLRDCSVTSYSVCVPGADSFNDSAANSVQAQTSESIAASTLALVPQTTPTVAPNSQSYYATTVPANYSAGTPDICAVTSTTANSANATYASAAAQVTVASNVSLPAALNLFGSIPALNQGQRVTITLELVSPGQEVIQTRIRARVGSAPTSSTGNTSGSITNASPGAQTLNLYATANGQVVYLAVDRILGTATFPTVNLKYQIFNPTCGAGTIPLPPSSNTSAQTCWTCKAGYSNVASCPAGTARAGLAGCFQDVPPSCSGGSSITLCGGVSGSPATPTAGSTTCCRAKTCAAGWVLNAAQTLCVRCNNATYPLANGSPPTLCATACAAGYTWDGSNTAGNCVPGCPAATPAWTLDAPRDRCVRCPTATPAYTLNAAAATCARNYCPAGWSGPSSGNCSQQSCAMANACAAGRTCVGAVGSARCSPQCSLCGSGTCTQTPAAPAAATSITCTPQNPCYTTSSANRGDGHRYGEMIYRFTVPVRDATKPNTDPANWYFYHFALLRQAAGTALVTDANAFIYVKPADAADTNAATDVNFGGRVLDCNRDANKWNVIGNTTETERYKRSELNSYLLPGDYYLVVDNKANTAVAATSPAYNFILQIGAFDDATPFAAPSYKQAVQALNSIGAKTIGVDSSGVSCQQGGIAATNAAQYDTRAFLEQLGRDTGSVDGVTGKPFVVPIRQNAGDCSGAAGSNGLQTAVEDAVRALTQTLRQDISLRAVFTNQTVSSPVFVPPVAPAQFIQSVEALPSTTVTNNCGSLPTITPIGNDVIAGYQKFQVCLPGTSVVFQVTFVMPTTIPRLTYDQYFRFDLVILRGVGEVGRVPVVLKLPKLPIPGDFYRDYDMTDVCPSGTRIIWDRFGWDSDDPLTDPLNSARIGSKIDMNVIMGTSLADLVAKTGTADEKSLATAKASPWPPNTEVGSAVLGPVLNYQRENFLRVHFRLYPSQSGSYPDNQIYVPTLRSWQVFISCPPSE